MTRTCSRWRRAVLDERGTALVAATILLFSFTAAAMILLARDYDQRIATRSVAQAVAFQAARAGAQQIDVEVVRRDGLVVLDREAAEEQARLTAQRLLIDQGETGTVIVSIEADRVLVVVEIVDVIEGGFEGSRTAVVRAEGAARAISG
ncbi:MAG: hypothetical protein ACO225_06725 [Ilumatobacteraceae bacterium]